MSERRIGWRDCTCLRLTDNDRSMILLELLKGGTLPRDLGFFLFTNIRMRAKGAHIRRLFESLQGVAESLLCAKGLLLPPWPICPTPHHLGTHAYTRTRSEARNQLSKSTLPTLGIFPNLQPKILLFWKTQRPCLITHNVYNDDDDDLSLSVTFPNRIGTAQKVSRDSFDR